jgi:Beige/BEACH domain.
LHYLIRLEPFTTQSKNLQGGCFDVPDRLFMSMKKSYKSTQSYFGDSKELIPEFFYLPEMFKNLNNEDFKLRQNKDVVDDVTLPR